MGIEILLASLLTAINPGETPVVDPSCHPHPRAADFAVRAYGAKGDGVTKDTAAIQKTIDAAAAAGGGRVTVSEGVYASGSLRLRAGVELHLGKGAVLLGSARSEDYDDFPDEVCTIHPENSKKVFVYGWDADNVSITGEGTIDAQGPKFFNQTEGMSHWEKPPVQRPRMVQLVRCRNVRLQGVTFKDSPCWTMLIRLCENVTVDGITIDGDQRMINNDGIDFDGCRHVRVGHSRFRTCDDCIVLRAMREPGIAEKVTCEDIIVSNCTLNSACQTVRLGCPSDDTIRHALFKNLEGAGYNGIFADYPERYLRADDEGYMDISDITFENYRGTFRGSAIQIVSEPGVKIRRADGFVFRNFDVTTGEPLRFIGNFGREIGSVLLENARVQVKGRRKCAPYVARGCTGLEFRNVTFTGAVRAERGSEAALKRGESVSWESVPKRTK